LSKTITLIGVPSSAGAHWPVQEKAPQYLRDARLVEHLEAVGLRVFDDGDLPRVRFSPDRENRRQQNIGAVAGVAREVAKRVSRALQSQAIPLVVGGDCTIGVGTVAGFAEVYTDVGLLYFDGHTDLNTPRTSASGILDSMGVAHMIGMDGAAKELSRIGPRFPLLAPERLVLFGYNPREINASEPEALRRHGLANYSSDEIRRDPLAAAAALGEIERRAERFVIHLDVDVIDFTDLPLADVPQFSGGLPFRDVLACLCVFASSRKFAGLTVAEVNPDHADEEGAVAETFVRGLAEALAGSRKASAS
jgi:arginase